MNGAAAQSGDRGHALVVGGSGMLAGVCLALAGRGWGVSVVGRRAAPLEDLAARAASAGKALRTVPVDYTREGEFQSAVAAAAAAMGPIRLAITWIRSSAEGVALPVVVEQLEAAAATGALPLLVRVLGSAAGSPEAAGDASAVLGRAVSAREVRVVLGFVRAPAGSRWLTHEEICAAVLRAADEGRDVAAGTTEPWSARPGG